MKKKLLIHRNIIVKKVIFKNFVKSLLCIMAIINTEAIALIYRCDLPNGTVEFRDRPCQTSLDHETVIPLVYEKTDLKIVKQEEREVDIHIKNQAKETFKNTRALARVEKKRLLDQEKAERRLKRCQRIDERIRGIEDKLRAGCKPKRQKHLNEELLHCQKMKRRYCSTTP